VAVPPSFEHFAAIDWSGAVGERQRGIAVAICGVGRDAPVLVRPGHIWSRQEVLAWLTDAMPVSTLVGIDMSPGLPFGESGYFPRWNASPANAHALWAMVDTMCADDPHLCAKSFVDHVDASRYFRRHAGRTGDRFGTAPRGRLRLVEERQRAQNLSPTSCFNLVGAAQVGKSSLTAMRVLHRLADKLPIWPFDPLPEQGSVLVEIYTSIAARAAGIRRGLSKIRDATSLDAALAVLGSAAHVPLASYTDHATDALLSAAWLRSAAFDPELWNPPGLSAVAATEGWTFGVR